MKKSNLDLGISVDSNTVEYFSGDWNKIRKEFQDIGINFMEIRAEDLMGHGDGEIPKNLPEKARGCHLSNLFSWYHYYTKNESEIRKLFPNGGVFLEYFPQSLSERWKKEIELGNRVKSEYYVFHPSQVHPPSLFEGRRSVYFEQIKDVLEEIVYTLSEETGGKLCLENDLFFAEGAVTPEEIAKVIDEVGRPGCGIALDTAHLVNYLLVRKRIEPKELPEHINDELSNVEDKIGLIHLSDVERVGSSSVSSSLREEFFDEKTFKGRRKVAIKAINELTGRDHVPIGRYIDKDVLRNSLLGTILYKVPVVFELRGENTIELARTQISLLRRWLYEE